MPVLNQHVEPPDPTKALNKSSFVHEWREGGVRDEWAEEVLKENRAAEVRSYVREMEEHLRWKDFALRATMQHELKKLLASAAAGPLLRDSDTAAKAAGMEQPLKQVLTKIANLEYDKMEQLIDDLATIAAATSNPEQVTCAVKEALQPLATKLESTRDESAKSAHVRSKQVMTRSHFPCHHPALSASFTRRGHSDMSACTDAFRQHLRGGKARAGTCCRCGRGWRIGMGDDGGCTRSHYVLPQEADEHPREGVLVDGVDMDLLLQEDIREAGVRRRASTLRTS